MLVFRYGSICNSHEACYWHQTNGLLWPIWTWRHEFGKAKKKYCSAGIEDLESGEGRKSTLSVFLLFGMDCLCVCISSIDFQLRYLHAEETRRQVTDTTSVTWKESIAVISTDWNKQYQLISVWFYMYRTNCILYFLLLTARSFVKLCLLSFILPIQIQIQCL